MFVFLRRTLASLGLAAMLLSAPAVQAADIHCGPKDEICTETDKSCTADQDCKVAVGGYTCSAKKCYYDAIGLSAFNRGQTSVGPVDVQNVIADIKKPKLSTHLPGLTFSAVSNTLDSEGYIHLPFLGEFIRALYKFGLVAGSILAVIMIIKNGVKIILSAGGDEKLASYQQIGQVIIGLGLMWGSYVILYTVNPQLVEFKALRIKYIEPVPLTVYVRDDDSSEPGATLGLDEPGYIKYECRHQPANRNLTDTAFDSLFESYGNCIPYDWRYLKAMSFVESAYRAPVVNCAGFTGLFQTKTKYANSVTGRFGVTFGSAKDFEDQGKVNPTLQQPEQSIMVGTAMFIESLTMIADACPKADEAAIRYFLYVGHQSGTGALEAVLKKSCDPAESKATIQEFYATKKFKRPAGVIAQESDEGAKRFQHFITDLGVPEKSSKAIDATKCPLQHAELRRFK